MPFRLSTAVMLFIINCSVLLTSSAALAGPKEDVAAATVKWGETPGDGETKTLPARYSFTFVKDGGNWMIVDHHSSAMPAPPR